MQLEDNIGNKVILFTKEGNSRKEYYNGNNELLSTRIYIQKTNTNYSIEPKSDTIYYYRPVENDFSSIAVNKLSDTIINNQKLSGSEIIMKNYVNQSDYSYSQNQHYKYYFNRKYKVDPKLPKEIKEGMWNKVIKKHKSLITYYEIKGFIYTQVFQSSSISEENIKSSMFDIPQGYKLILLP